MARPLALSLLLNILIASTDARSLQHEHLHKRQAPPATLPSGWGYKGCYTDSVAQRTLATGAPAGADNSAATCIAWCNARGFTFAGTEYGAECFCGNAIGATGAPATSGCNMACSGAAGEACGGSNRISVYEKGGTGTPSNPENPGTPSSTPVGQGPANWGALGCYSDSVAQRVLTVAMGVQGGAANMSPESCTAACRAGNYKYAGVEYAAECFCGNTLQNGHTKQTSGCDMPCNGDRTQMCGGSNRINIFEFGAVASSSVSSTRPASSSSSVRTSSTVPPSSSSTRTSSAAPSSSTVPAGQPGWRADGCYTDSVGQRALAIGMPVQGAVTATKCKEACRNAGFTVAGVEYAAECFCDNSVKNGNGPAPDGNAGCNMPCQGDATEMCGGANRLNLFRFTTGGTTSSSSSTRSSTLVPSSTRSSSVSTPSASGLPTGWKYHGCYVDGPGFRIMNYQQPDSGTMTPASCARACVAAGYTIAGLEFSYQCFCDNVIRENGQLAAQDSQCSSACAGNANEKCGGPNRLSIYSSQDVLKQVEKPKPKAKVDGWEYQGCITDFVDWRIFPWQLVNKTGNTAEWCLGKCAEYGYHTAGMEFGEECYCGDLEDISASPSVKVAETECNVVCPGDPEEICGAGNRISLYQWKAEPIYVWSYPQNAGRYEFLVGGPVIPLIVQPAKNGKVSFLEKKGTGPPNSTGAYEFDPSLSSNIATTFREMQGIKTDIFCAAGLTMPDKAGRQINIGGWSLESTFGIRIMTPDGELGKNGTSTWRENVDVLKLQAGRWYPTGMNMANGSMLIVGGQSGSNGPPVPNMEVLPRVGPIKHAEYLRITDPFNLYPFLTVLPSGGIFIQYYNEARILDEVSLDTVKILPNLPASVANPRGGRTYPFEGTMVLLPQEAPYTKDLEVLVCGGAASGLGIDNCVSTAPDAANPTWTIERMPSRRVISCIATLPDGTYLILNGAKNGEAGFGLAKKPNLNAVLYDSRKPKNRRMSVMGNTTIPRMYHSEAVVLDDGRVLVSGSDPQDAEFNQEYRLEVYLPPYLTDGRVQPKIAITAAQSDWAYGGTYTFTITSATASPASQWKVSLLGAESSTHGNNMGARVLFPAFSCTGTTCRVTAPPRRHVAPPGWYRLFFLDGPTPSFAKWVRIGGDPAGLGNWPNFPDFAPLPGV